MADYERDLVPVPRLSIRPLLSQSLFPSASLFLCALLSYGDSSRFQIAPPTVRKHSFIREEMRERIRAEGEFGDGRKKRFRLYSRACSLVVVVVYCFYSSLFSNVTELDVF